MNNIKEILERFYQYCRNKRISKSAIKSIPYIGSSIDEFIYGGDLKALINKVHEEHIKKQEEILNAIKSLLEDEQHQTSIPTIVTIGSGTAEYILKYEGEKIDLGNKHSANLEVLYGGSGVNYSMRLLSSGYEAMPILAIGVDDLGKQIQSELLKAALKGGASKQVLNFIKPQNSEIFFDPNIQTSSTVILVHGSQRTIFTQKLRKGQFFIKHVERRIADLFEMNPCAVMIGHIHSDGANITDKPGECTKNIVNFFKNKSIVYTNFGNNQILLGLDFWKETLSNIDVFQLNLKEAKRFFSDKREKKSLSEIVDIIRNLNLTAVITLDRFGAIGIHKEKKDRIILAWPLIEGEDIIDSTGAGDAFGAGLVSHLCGHSDFNFYEFQEAIETARTWAALACKTIGGSGNSPDRKSLEDYKEKIAKEEKKPVEVKDQYYSTEIISLIDIAFK